MDSPASKMPSIKYTTRRDGILLQLFDTHVQGLTTLDAYSDLLSDSTLSLGVSGIRGQSAQTPLLAQHFLSFFEVCGRIC
jgi:hypothetical protein